MKAVILAGGFGTRLGEETDVIPKPMIDIGGKPVLWHILKLYSKFGINEGELEDIFDVIAKEHPDL